MGALGSISRPSLKELMACDSGNSSNSGTWFSNGRMRLLPKGGFPLLGLLHVSAGPRNLLRAASFCSNCHCVCGEHIHM
jgi:hypothetical protein